MILPVGENSRGFSLLELLLVLILLALSSAVVLPNIEKGLQERELRGSALELAAAARELRSRAVYDGVPQQLLLNLRQNSYLFARDKEVQLPRDVKFTEVAGGEALGGGTRQFVFFPNGSSHGGSIGLAGSRDSIFYSVRFEPLTGKIEVLRGDKS